MNFGLARIKQVLFPGRRNQRIDGEITVNGHAYQFRSGGHGRGNLPRGTYTVSPHLWNRQTPGMTVGGVGFSFALSDKFDARVGATRKLLRIHPDGRGPGTSGCMGIVGSAEVQKKFREDMRAELLRHHGRWTIKVA
jgi:hypothetical protein